MTSGNTGAAEPAGTYLPWMLRPQVRLSALGGAVRFVYGLRWRISSTALTGTGYGPMDVRKNCRAQPGHEA